MITWPRLQRTREKSTEVADRPQRWFGLTAWVPVLEMGPHLEHYCDGSTHLVEIHCLPDKYAWLRCTHCGAEVDVAEVWPLVEALILMRQ